jgi:hypothetical protein
VVPAPFECGSLIDDVNLNVDEFVYDTYNQVQGDDMGGTNWDNSLSYVGANSMTSDQEIMATILHEAGHNEENIDAGDPVAHGQLEDTAVACSMALMY